jgi:hypothetical protein
VTTARGTGRSGSMKKPPGSQESPAAVVLIHVSGRGAPFGMAMPAPTLDSRRG